MLLRSGGNHAPPKVMQQEKHNCSSFFPGLVGLFKDKLHSLAIDLVPGWDNSSCSLFNNVLHELMTSRITVSGCLVSISLIILLIASFQYISISISLLPFDGCEKKRNIDVHICILPVVLAQCSLIFLVPSKIPYCTLQLWINAAFLGSNPNHLNILKLFQILLKVGEIFWGCLITVCFALWLACGGLSSMRCMCTFARV